MIEVRLKKTGRSIAAIYVEIVPKYSSEFFQQSSFFRISIFPTELPSDSIVEDGGEEQATACGGKKYNKSAR